ncbi:MAG: Lrp/AsnC family transcriptional regulator [Acidobacteriota bacterium]|nr:Lrp/AsnC family transcriptional regulator [Acidobacteriota bacterium]
MKSSDHLDRIDFAILAVLQNNARLANNRLAELVGVAPSTCLERVRRLARIGVIRGYHCDVDPDALGVGLEAMIAVRLRRHSRDIVDSFRRYVADLAEVRSVFHVTGGDDFLVHVAVRDSDHLRDLALDSFTTRPEVDHIQTRLIFDYTPTWRLPVPDERAI